MDFDEPVAVAAELTAETDIVAIGGHVSARSLIAAYARGMFPMDINADVGGSDLVRLTAWFAPDQRAVLRFPGMHVSRSLRRAMRRFQVTLDSDFEGVLAGCADPARPHGWITADYAETYRELHGLGFAHSVEVWDADGLAGGLLGVQLGGLFCADSKFHRVTDASKAAVAGLSDLVFGAADADSRLIDAQWLTPHLESLGFRGLARADYESLLPGLLSMPPLLGAPGRRTV